jgi:hypothetical protein
MQPIQVCSPSPPRGVSPHGSYPFCPESYWVFAHRWWGAYERHIAPEQHTIGKAQTQKIESKHINLRMRIKRLVRRTICFSKTTTMHDLVLGLFINRYEFGRSI